MHDAVQFELRGRPAVAIVTEPFVRAGQAMASLDGFDDFPLVTLPHPTAELSRRDVTAAALRLMPDVAAVLLTGRP